MIKSFLKKIYDEISCKLFLINGMRPWSFGYNAYKKKKILEVLSKNSFNLEKINKNYGLRIDERIVEYPWLFSRLPDGAGKLLDAGSVLNFEKILLQRKIRSKQVFISNLLPETCCYWGLGISYIYEDVRESCFKNNYFDWVVSLSTIEHIGLDNTLLYTDDLTKKENNPGSYLQAVQEYFRILKPQGVLYLSFPFGRKKNHGWFQVFDASMVEEIINVFSPQSFKEKYFKYEEDGWKPSSREESKDATYFDINVQKDYDSDFAAASRAIVCLELVK